MKIATFNNKYIYGGELSYQGEGVYGYQLSGKGVIKKGRKLNSWGYKGIDKLFPGAVFMRLNGSQGAFPCDALQKKISGGLDLLPEFRAGPV